MFTLKFCNYYDDYTRSETILCCPHYNVYRYKGKIEITLYKDYTSAEGVTYTLADKDIGIPYWEVCYVENVNGKTIEKIKPYYE